MGQSLMHVHLAELVPEAVGGLSSLLPALQFCILGAAGNPIICLEAP
jgi:hypothetical protein